MVLLHAAQCHPRNVRQMYTLVMCTRVAMHTLATSKSAPWGVMTRNAHRDYRAILNARRDYCALLMPCDARRDHQAPLTPCNPMRPRCIPSTGFTNRLTLNHTKGGKPESSLTKEYGDASTARHFAPTSSREQCSIRPTSSPHVLGLPVA